jgi:hypothetical protein
MKKLILCSLLIFALLAVCGCPNGLCNQNQLNSETGQEPSTHEPNPEQEQTENNETEPSETAPPKEKPPEIVPPEVIPPEIITPEIVPPETEHPETLPPVIIPPEVKPTEVKPPVVVPPEIKPPVVVPPEIKPPEVVPPEVIPPEEKPPEEKLPEEKPPETEPSEEKPPEEKPPEVIPPEEKPPEVVPTEKSLLHINELMTEFSATAKQIEYIEFKAMREGNLKDVKLHIMYDAQNPFMYSFPNIDVKEGEYITLHLRTLETDSVNELGDDLTESTARGSSSIARDLWIEGSTKRLHKTDIVYLKDTDGGFMDAVALNETPAKAWKPEQEHFSEIMAELYSAGMWKSADGQKPLPSDAVDTSEIRLSLYKSVSRYESRENTHSAADWYITANNGATPGKMNR